MTNAIQTTQPRSGTAAAEPARGKPALIGATDAPGRTFGATLEGYLTLDDAFSGPERAPEPQPEETTPEPSADEGTEAEPSEDAKSSESKSGSGEGAGEGEEPGSDDGQDVVRAPDPVDAERTDAPEEPEIITSDGARGQDVPVSTSLDQGAPARSVRTESDVTVELTAAAQVDLGDLSSQELKGADAQNQAADGSGEVAPLGDPRATAPERAVRHTQENQGQRPSPEHNGAQNNANTNASRAIGSEQSAPREGSVQAPSTPAPGGEPAAAFAGAVGAAATTQPRAQVGAPAKGVPGVSVAPVPSQAPGIASGSASGGNAGLDLGAQPQNQVRVTPNPGEMGEKFGAMKRNVLAQVERGLGSVLKTNGGSLRIRLNPDHLGELQIKLDLKDGAVSARFTAETTGAQRALEDGVASLRAALEQRGVRVEQIVIEGPSADEGFRMGGEGSRDGSSGSGSDADERGGRGGGEHGGLDGDVDKDDQQQRGVWTEFGLDAIA